MSEQSVQSRGGAKVAWAASVAGAASLAAAAEAQQAVEVAQPASVVNGNLVIETATGPISVPAGSFTQVGNTFFVNAATFAELSLLAQQAITGFGGAMASVGVVAAGGAGVFAAINFLGDDEVEVSGAVLDTGSSSSDGVTNSNTISVSVSGGASWEFSTDGGQTWQTGSGDSFAVPDGTYAAGALQVRSENEDGSFVTSTVNASPVTVDTALPAALSAITLPSDIGASTSDGVTKNNSVTVDLGSLEANATWQYSTDGGQSWEVGSGASFVLDDGVYSAGDIQVRQIDAAGNFSPVTSSSAITIDTVVNALTLALNTDTGSSDSDNNTTNGLIDVSGIESGATWQYSTNGGSTWTDGTGTSFTLIGGSYAASAVQVRQTDVAGNISSAASNASEIKIDNAQPAAPGLSLASDTGSDTSDGVSKDATIDVSGIESGATWQYSTDGGANWSVAQADTVTSFELSDGTYAIGDIQVRQTDAAGNPSPATGGNAAQIIIDTAVPTGYGLALASAVSGGFSASGDVNVSGLEGGTSTWQYSTNGGSTWTDGTGTSFTLIDGSYAANAVQVRETDLAGNVGAVVSISGAFGVDTGAPAAPGLSLASDTGSDTSDGVSKDATIDVSGIESGATWQYSTDGGANWSAAQADTVTSFELADKTYAIGDIQVRQTDAAGNPSPTTGSNAAQIIIDTAVPTGYGLALASAVSGGFSASGDVNVSGLEGGTSTWQYSTNGGSTWTDGTGTSFTLIDGSYAANAVQVRETDLAGNVGAVVSISDAFGVDTGAPAAPGLSLASDTGSDTSDGVSKDATIDVSGIESGATWQYSTDGGVNWSVAQADTVTSFELSDGTYAIGDIQVRQTDAAGNPSPATGGNAAQIIIDTAVPNQTVTIASITDNSGLTSDFITNDNDGLSIGLTLSAALASDETLEWSTDGSTFASTGITGSGTAYTIDGSSITSTQTVYVRITDAAGNSSTAVNQEITIDALAPTQRVTIASITDNSGLTSDFITNDNDGLSIGLTLSAALASDETLEWSTDGSTFASTGITGSGTAYTIDGSSITSTQTVYVRVTDAAGNSGPLASQLITIDTEAVALGLSLATDTGSSDSDGITNDATINVSGLEDGATWEYSTNGGDSWQPGTGSSFELADGAYVVADAVQARQTDLAGNVGAAVSISSALTIDTGVPTALGLSLATDTGSSDSDGITNDATINVLGIEDGATWEYNTDAGHSSWQSGTGSSFELAYGIYRGGQIQVRQMDEAGNTSSIAINMAQITIDLVSPLAGRRTLNITSITEDSGLLGDFITNDADGLSIGLTLSAALASDETLEWSTDGSTFASTGITGSGTAYTIDGSSITSTQTVYVRATDVAGNSSTAVNQEITIDAVAPTQTVTIASIDASDGVGQTDFSTADDDGISVNLSLDVALASDETLEWSTDGSTFASTGITGSGTAYAIDGSSITSTQTVYVRISDAAGNSSTPVSQEIAIEVTVSGSVTEGEYDTMTTSGNVGGTTSAAVRSGTHGEFTLEADGTYTYVLNKTAAVTALDVGQTEVDTISVVTSNGTVNLSITINGAESEVVFSSGHTGSVNEGNKHDTAMTASGTVVLDDLDDADDTTTVTVTAGTYSNGWGSVTINAAGVWTYSLDQSKVQHLKTGENFVDEVYVTLSDGSTHAIEVTVNGADEVINDIYEANQHHHDNSGLTNFDGTQSVWDRATGINTKVFVVDDGVDSGHADLAANYDAGLELTYSGTLYAGYDSAAGQSTHGTSVAGVIGAVGQNGTGMTGVAFNTDVTGYVFIGGASHFTSGGKAVDLYKAMFDNWANFDVVNNSWGSGDGSGFSGSRDFVDDALSTALTTGRGGLGTVVVKSAGNDNPFGNVYRDQFGGSPEVIAVGAIVSDPDTWNDTTNSVSFYSNKGMGLLVSAPSSSGFENEGIHTLDRSDAEGDNGGSTYTGADKNLYTDAFGGTSSSGPVVAAVAALMLDANDALGWRDVKDIFALSSTLAGSADGSLIGYEEFTFQTNGANNWNGGGLHFSGDYGYGNVNAHNAVAIAETYFLPGTTALTSSNDYQLKTYADTTDKTINDSTSTATDTVSYSFTIGSGDSIEIEHLDITVDWQDYSFDDTYSADFKITLTDPDGNEYTIVDPAKDLYNAEVLGTFGTFSAAGSPYLQEPATITDVFIIDNQSDDSQWTYGVEALRGDMSEGTWTVSITDTNIVDQWWVDTTLASSFDTDPTIQGVTLDFRGSTASDDDVYYFTDEFLTMVNHPLFTAEAAARQTIVDASGTDTVNAAAVSTDLTIDGSRGATNALSYDGEFGNINIGATTDLENFISGSGNDTLTGNALHNKIWARYGNDTIDAGGGDDTIDGGYGNDTLTGGTGADIFVFGNQTGSDQIMDFEVDADKVHLDGTGITRDELYDNLSLSGGNAVYSDGEIIITFVGITSLVGLTDDFVLV